MMRYLSLLRYKPRDNSKLGLQCQGLVNAIKNDQALADGTHACEAVGLVTAKQRKHHKGIEDIFNGDAVLIPIPRSAPRSKDALWPSLRIAKGLEKHGLASEVIVGVERIKNIRASHSSGSNRPSVEEHVATLRCCLPLNAKPAKIILVDDVITKGTTAWACRNVIRGVLPKAEIIVFAAVSTERSDATLIGPIAIRDDTIQYGPYGPWRPDTSDSSTWSGV